MARSKSRNIADLVQGRGNLTLNSNNISAHFTDIDFLGTGSITLPSGTTAQRDGSPTTGAMRFNTTLGRFEGYWDGAWAEIGGGSSDTWTTDNFTGDGSTAAYTLTIAPSSEDNVIAFIEGVFQNPGDYVLNGTTITFDENVPNGQKVIVHSVKATVAGNNLNQDLFAGDGSTTDFTLSIAPINENNTMVYIDGVYQNKSTYSTSGTTLAFSTAPPNSTAIEALCFTQTNINTPTSNSVGTASLIDDSVTSAKLGHALTLQGNTVIDGSMQTENISIPDNYALRLGSGQDLQLYHDGSQSIIQDVGTGQLKILGENTIHIGSATGSHSYIRALKSGAVELYHNNVKKLETTSTGVTANGIVTATTFTGALTGNVTGDVTGNTAGTHTGPVTGNTVGTHTGAVVGNVTGDVTGDVSGELTGTINTATTATTQANSVSSNTVATTAFVSNKLTELIGGAPSTLNDLNELAAAINDDADYNTTLTTALATKLPLSGGAMTGPITTNSTFDGVDIAARDAILTSTTTTAGAALPKAGGTLTGGLNIATASSQGLIVKTTANAEPFVALQRNNGSNGVAVLRSLSGGSLAIDTGATGAGQTTAITIDSSQHTLFAGNIDVTGTITGDDGLSIQGGSGNAYLQVGSDTGSWTWKNYQASHKLTLEDSDGTGEVLAVDTTGNLLVGTTSTIPYTLTSGTGAGINSAGTIMAGAAAEAGLFNRVGGSGNVVNFYRTGTLTGGISVNSGYIGVGSGTVWTGFYTSGSTKAVIPMGNSTGGAAVGSIDLGLTSTNHRFKDLWLSGVAYAPLVVANDIKATGSGGISFQTDDGIKRIEIADSGDVNIGLGAYADPRLKIKSAAGGDPAIHFDGSAANRGAQIKFLDYGSFAGGFIDYHHNGDKMKFGAGSSATPTMTVGDQVVGIGTDSPTTMLQVEGTVLAENAKLKAVAQSIAGTTAVDIVVYDTRKDSDGGAWRKRTKNASWYNEPLNTSTRGARKEFPVVAVIVCELGRVVIYDADDPTLPMWMVFNGLNGGSSYTWHGSGYSGESNRCIAMLNGTLAIGVRGSVSSVSGLSTVNFMDEVFHKYGGAAGTIRRDISLRNNAFSVRNDTTGGHAAASKNIFGVAMTALKGADIDPGTGLPEVTIAIATAEGISLTKKDSNNNVKLIHITAGSGSAYNGVGHVDITDEDWLIFEQDNSSTPRSEFYIPIPDQARTTQTSDGVITDKVVLKFYSTATHNYPYFKGEGIINSQPMKGHAHALKGSGGELTLVDPKPYDKEHTSVCYIGADHNTGWLTGGTKLAALNSTTSGTVVDTDVLGGIGDFTDGNAWSAGTGWSTGSNILTGTAVTNYILPVSNGILVTGEQYRITITQSSYTTGAAYVYMGTGAPGTGNHYMNLPSAAGTYTYTLVAYNTNFGIYGANYTGQIDNVTIVKCDPDRSAWTAGVEAIGTVNKTAVATGAELMAYGPFGTSAYLQQPFNSNLQVGTGTVTYSAWCYKSGSVVGYLFDRANGNGSNRFAVYFAGSTSIDSYTPGGALNGVAVPDNEWFNYTAVKGNGKLIVYINGERKGSVSTAENLDVVAADNIPLKIGVRYTADNAATDLKIALFKVSTTAVSHSQVRKNYEDEKHLFSENAKATISGTDDSITGFAYDSDTELLHVGSSWGRSVFDGLTRTEYSTDVVTTAISASNGLVAEE